MSTPTKTIKVPMPDVDTECPQCKNFICLSGYEFEPTISLGTFGKSESVYCDACDHEFDVVIGGAV